MPKPMPMRLEPTFMPRRAMLVAGATGVAGLAALGGCASPGAPGQPPLPWVPALPALSDAQAWRLLNRLSWGATDAEWARLQAQGPDHYLRAQLRPAGDDGLPAAVQAQIDGLRISRVGLVALWQEAEQLRRSGEASPSNPLSEPQRQAQQQAYQRHLNGLAREAAARHLWRALYSRHQLQSQMVWHWFNHFNVHQYKGSLRLALGDFEERAIRPHALGRFRDLLGAVVRHPAMLVYLDNAQSSANRPNENLARELMELHTLGVDGGYTQADVQALARVLTGHGVNFSGNAPRLRPEQQALWVADQGYEFNPARHDAGPKTLLGQTVPGVGAAQLDAALDQLARHPATARHVSRRLAAFFLGDAVPSALVSRMAAAFERSDGAIATVLQVLLHAPEFRDEPPAGAALALKDPVHYVVSAVRATWPADTPVRNTQPLQNWLNRLGQGLYNRATPDGYPLGAQAWTGSGQMATRFEFARAVAGGLPALFNTLEPPMAPPEFPVADGAAAAATGAAPTGAAAAMGSAATPPSMVMAGQMGGGMAGPMLGTGNGMVPGVMAAPTPAPARPASPSSAAKVPNPPGTALPVPPPQLMRPAMQALLLAQAGPATRSVLAATTQPAQWQLLALASPDFMAR